MESVIFISMQLQCHNLHLETILCVDEQMISFKSQINIKQIIKNKPNKWGINHNISFSSILKNKGIRSLRTILINLFQKPTRQLNEKGGRCSADCIVSNDGIVVTKWYDDKSVMIASNFVEITKVDIYMR